MRLPQEFITELSERVDIVELINSYVPLKKRGRLWWGLCPFHNEKTPSFAVYPDTKSFYCFGCGVGGDAIAFIRHNENLEYVEAAKLLAERMGMSLPEDTDDGAAKRRARLLDANRAAARYFFKMLNSESGANARAYLRGKRGLDDATIVKFGIGYAPDGWDNLRTALNSQGFSDDELVQAGLCGRSAKSGSVYDFFRERAMFPIIDERGSVVGFSGRTLADDRRKYVNTPDTPVYKKSRTLYALNIAKKCADRTIILCEGQMDVIALHRAGFDGAVAACGTALTDEQAHKISQYADEVVLCYDSDGAGQKAAKRAIEIFGRVDIGVRVLQYEGAKDPDEFIKKFGRDKFAELLSGAGNATAYELEKLKSSHDLETDAGRVDYLKDATAILAKITSPTERDLFAGRVAEETGVSKAAVTEQAERERRRRFSAQRRQRDSEMIRTVGAKRDAPRLANRAKLGEASAQRRLIALVFYAPDLARRVCERVAPQDFLSPDEGAIFEALTSLIKTDQFQGIQSVSPLLSTSQLSMLSGLIAESAGINFTPDDADFLTDRIVKAREAPERDEIKAMDPEQLKLLIEQTKRKDGTATDGR